MLTLNWGTCGDNNHWCNLKNLTLPLKRNPTGVYMIWHDGDPERVVRLGQGDISDRLSKHRKDKDILAYAKKGTLRAKWATVSARQLDGVERYLADHWKPLIGEVFPDAEPIEVNSPCS